MTQPPAGGATLPPVFLHGLWRSGSTYLWSRFRAREDTLCFFEPLHEGLGRLNPRRLAQAAAPICDGLRHPRLDRAYFAEYAPLLKRRGVRGFEARFSRDDFALEPEQAHPRLEAYLRRLIDEAARQGRRPVLGFNRTSFRIGRLRERFGSVDVFIARDPEAIWASYMDHFRSGNHSFMQRTLWMLERNSAHPLFAPLAERLGVRHGLARRLGRAKSHYPAAIADLPDSETYLMVRYLALAAMAQAAARCDLIVDMDAFGRLPKAAERVQARVLAATGLGIDVSDGRSTPARCRMSHTARERADATALELLPDAAFLALQANGVRADLSILALASRRMLDRLSARAISLSGGQRRNSELRAA